MTYWPQKWVKNRPFQWPLKNTSKNAHPGIDNYSPHEPQNRPTALFQGTKVAWGRSLGLACF